MRALIRLVLFLLVLAVLAYTAIWFYAASEVKTRLNAFRDESRGSSRSLQFDLVEVSGFPLTFTLNLTNAKAEDGRRGISWTGPEETGVSWTIFKPFTVSALVSGRHTIRPVGSSSTQIPFDLKVDSRELAFTGGLDRRLKAVSLDFDTLTVSNDLFGEVMWDKFVFRIDPPSGSGADAGSRFLSSVEKISLPGPLSTVGTFTNGSASGLIVQGLPGSNRYDHMKVWQQAGGKVLIEEYKGNLDHFRVDGTGSLQLDDALQLDLDLTTYASGLDGLIKQASSLGFITKEQANAARFGASMFRNPARSGDGRELVLPLKIESNWVVFGPLKLKKLPKINWPR